MLFDTSWRSKVLTVRQNMLDSRMFELNVKYSNLLGKEETFKLSNLPILGYILKVISQGRNLLMERPSRISLGDGL